MIMNLFALQCAYISDKLNIGNSLEKAFMLAFGIFLFDILVLIGIMILLL